MSENYKIQKKFSLAAPVATAEPNFGSIINGGSNRKFKKTEWGRGDSWKSKIFLLKQPHNTLGPVAESRRPAKPSTFRLPHIFHCHRRL